MTTEKPKKAVLIVDNELHICKVLKDNFTDFNKKVDCPYEFEVDIALSAAECIEKVRTKKGVDGDTPPYDIIVLDIRMEKENSGVEAAAALHVQLGWETPIRIIVTGFPNYRDCVETMRHGVWDYVIKEEVGGLPFPRIVVDSALTRLQQLDVRREQEQQIAADWLPRHFYELRAGCGGQLVALWHRPKVTVIASGRDAFELEAGLEEWRKQHPSWQQPFVVQIPLSRGEGEEEV